MLKPADELIGLTLGAADGDIGKVKDIYFDDQAWSVQYFVAETGGWLTGRQVLISPQCVGRPDWDAKQLPVSMTKKQIEDSPHVSEDEPVSRQAQTLLGAYFNWGTYWTDYLAPGLEVMPGAIETDDELSSDANADPHLRSLTEVRGYTIEARDGRIGHVEDFVVQTDGWILRYMLVDTRNWLPGRKVLVSPAWITELDWVQVHVKADLPLESIRNAPEFNPDRPLERAYEARLFEYYGFPPYWEQTSETE